MITALLNGKPLTMIDEDGVDALNDTIEKQWNLKVINIVYGIRSVDFRVGEEDAQ